MEMTNQMETRKYWASVLAFWSYWVQSIVMSWSIAWAGTQRAVAANYDIDNDRMRIIDEDLALAMMRRAVQIDLIALYRLQYGFKYFLYCHRAMLFGSGAVQLLHKCGWSMERISRKMDRVVEEEMQKL